MYLNRRVFVMKQRIALIKRYELVDGFAMTSTKLCIIYNSISINQYLHVYIPRMSRYTKRIERVILLTESNVYIQLNVQVLISVL